MSKQPWFAADQAKGAARLRDGMWVALKSADCKVDPEASADKWPQCASPVLFEGNRVSGPRDEEEGRASKPETWDSLVYLLVGGQPMIQQIEFRDKAKPGQESKPDEVGYIYLGLNPTARDAEGRIVAAQLWPVVCGPLPEKKGAPAGPVTSKPFKGLTVDGMACTARSIDALRNAARQSQDMLRARKGNGVTIRWLKEKPA